MSGISACLSTYVSRGIHFREGEGGGGSRLSILTRYRGETFFFTRCNLNSICSTEKQRNKEREREEIVIRYGFLVSFEEITLLSETKVFKIMRDFTEDIGGNWIHSRET